MTRRPRILILATAALLVPVHAAPPVMDAVAEKMQEAIAAKEIAGSVTLVADGTEILHLSADGFSSIEQAAPMAEDAIFWIASMTKPITATALMMLQDEGKLSVDDPVSKYLPEFSGDKAGITIKQCLTHTSGLSEATGEESEGIATLEDLMPLFAGKPLVFEPGSEWQYCQTGINAAARVVEVVSGKAFPEFLQDRLFGPLGMRDTSFYPSEAQISRIASSYKQGNDGNLEKAEITFLGSKSIADKARYPRANGGLFSTAADYLKFAQMILRGGESGGKRYLKQESIQEMTRVQTGDLASGFVPGSAWGLGWSIVREPQGVTAALSPGTFGHGGLFGTQAWVDPAKQRIYLLLVQRANFTNQGGADGSELRREFQNAAAK